MAEDGIRATPMSLGKDKASSTHSENGQPLFLATSNNGSMNNALCMTSSSSSAVVVGQTASSGTSSLYDLRCQSSPGRYPSPTGALVELNPATALHVDAQSPVLSFQGSGGKSFSSDLRAFTPTPSPPSPIRLPPHVQSNGGAKQMVRITGLPKGMTVTSLKELLSGLGLLDNIDPTITLALAPGGNTTMAYMCLSKPAEAVANLHGAKIGDTTLDVSILSSGDLQLPQTKPLNGLGSESQTTSPETLCGVGGGGGPLTPSYSSQSFNSMVFRLRGLPFSSRNEDVYEFIRSVQGVQNVSVCRCPEGRCTGDAFVELISPESASQLRQLHGKMMGPRYIEVIPSTPHDRNVIMRSAASKFRLYRNAPSNNTLQGPPGGPHTIMMGHHGTNIVTMSPPGLPIYGTTPPSALASPEYCAALRHQHSGRPEVLFSSAHSSPQLTPISSGVLAMDPSHFQRSASPLGSPVLYASAPNVPLQHGMLFATAASAPALNPGQQGNTTSTAPVSTVRVSGLPLHFTEESLAQCLSGVRIAAEGVHLVVNELGQTTGEAVVELQGPEDLESALAHHHKPLGDGHVLSVQRSTIDLNPHFSRVTSAPFTASTTFNTPPQHTPHHHISLAPSSHVFGAGHTSPNPYPLYASNNGTMAMLGTLSPPTASGTFKPTLPGMMQAYAIPPSMV